MVHPLMASPWTPEETSHINDRIPAMPQCLSTIDLIQVKHALNKNSLPSFLAELRIGSTDDPFSLFLEGWYLERKKLPSMTRDTFSGLLSDRSFSLLPPKQEHWRVPCELLSLASVSPSPFITETPQSSPFWRGKPRDVFYASLYCDPEGKK